MHIGPYTLSNPLILAPMAGITDLPFRRLCRRFGAAMALSEMVSSNPRLWHTLKSRQRLDHTDEPGIRWIQIAGSEAAPMAAAARFNQRCGAQIIDINMGCPAKKICRKAAGSALLSDPGRVRAILEAVTDAVSVPVTLKIRTGTDPDHRNALEIARIAEQTGVKSLTIHGRTRQCRFTGEAEYETIRQVKQSVSIPIIANGDISSPQQAKSVLEFTGADAIMIGRAAQGRPWVFQEMLHFLQTGVLTKPMNRTQITRIWLQHVREIHRFYGDFLGVRIARKHVGWYLRDRVTEVATAQACHRAFNGLTDTHAQLDFIKKYPDVDALKGGTSIAKCKLAS